MKTIILKYTNEDWETEYFRFEGNIMFSASCITYNVFVKFCDSLPEFRIIEKAEIRVDFEIENSDYGYLINGEDIEGELAVIAQLEMEALVEEYLVSEEIVFDLNYAASKIAPVLEKRCKEEINHTHTNLHSDKEKQKKASYQEHQQRIFEDTTPVSLEDYERTHGEQESI